MNLHQAAVAGGKTNVKMQVSSCTLCYVVILCDAVLCYAMLCYAMLLCYVMLCYVMLCYVTLLLAARQMSRCRCPHISCSLCYVEG